MEPRSAADTPFWNGVFLHSADRERLGDELEATRLRIAKLEAENDRLKQAFDFDADIQRQFSALSVPGITTEIASSALSDEGLATVIVRRDDLLRLLTDVRRARTAEEQVAELERDYQGGTPLQPPTYKCPRHGEVKETINSTINGFEGHWCMKCTLEALDRLGVCRVVEVEKEAG